MPPAVAVGSSAYNLAGERERRPELIKSHIMAQVSGSPKSLGEAVVDGYPESSVCRMKRFLKWSKSDPDFLAKIGVTNGGIPAGGNLDFEAILPHVPPWDEDEVITLVWNNDGIGEGTSVGISDPEKWVKRYMVRYHRYESYTWTYDSVSNTATIYREDEPGFVLHMGDYIPNDLYLYVYYLTDEYDGPQLASFWWIYRYNTGNAVLDAMMIEAFGQTALGSFYPPIPFRFENQPVTADSPSPALVSLYPTAREAFRRAYGLNFDQVQDKIMDEEQNPNLDDIDYIYSVQAVTFNTRENAGRKYIFKLFELAYLGTSNHSPSGKLNWFIQWENNAWASQTPPWKSLKVESLVEAVSNFRTQIKWAFMNKTTGTGLLKPDARVDEVWFEVLPDPVTSRPYPSSYEFRGFSQEVALCWQETGDSWKKFVITGLQYNNYVYQFDHTVVTAKQALQLTDKDSEFLVPLHETVFNSLSLVDALQVGSSCSWLVFNCLEIHKAEWYESGWFKVILVVVIIAVSVVAALVTGGTSLGVGGAAVAGVLTGSGLGVVAALIIAAAVDVLAGILISYLIGMVANEIFGDKWGPLIGAIVSFVFSFGLNVGSITEAISALSSPNTWIALATATGNGVAGYVQGQANQVAEETAKMLQGISEQSAEVQRKYSELVGGVNNGIDLGVLNQYRSDLTERPADFFARTLVTGSDIAEITLRQIADFTRNNLKLDLA